MTIKPKRGKPRRRTAPQHGTDWWTNATHALWARSGGRCERCDRALGGGIGVSRHHRMRRRDGGDRLSNLLLLCGSGTTGCHGWVTEHPDEAYANGWSVRALATTDPAEVPVRINGRLWVLDDHGVKRLIP